MRHCTVLLLALSTVWGIRAAGQDRESEFIVIVAGRQVGREQVRVVRGPTGWVITSTGRHDAPINLTINRFESKYTSDWQPTELRISALQGTRRLGLFTSFALTTAINEVTIDGTTNGKNDQVSARSVVIPNNFFAAYEALAARLGETAPGAEIPIYVAPEGQVMAKVQSVTAGQVQTPAGPVATRRFDLSIANAQGAAEARITIDGSSRFVRLELPTVSLVVVRGDLAAVSTRTEAARNATDTDVLIPAAGFNIAGTLTTPAEEGRLRHPAVVLVTGSTQGGRDATTADIPVLQQLAGALASRGYVVLRYDKRGEGQSGGRGERATLEDYADDLRGVVKWLSAQPQIDKRRIAVAGYTEGGAVAMLAAAKEKRIASLVLMAAPGTTGADLILEQQRHALDLLKAAPAERDAKIALQERIHKAVTTERGWDGIPPALRQQADTAWFRSFLQFNPAKVLPDVRQPVLIVHGELDTQVPPHHGDTLAALGRARKKAPATDLARLAGLNHLFVPASTGEVSEYRALPDRTVSAELTATLADWLQKR